MKILNVVLGVFLVLVVSVFASASFAMSKKSHDGEIIAFMEAINNSEISAAKVAKDKKIDSNVMNFADLMIDQHSKNLQEVTDLSKSANIPEDEDSAVKKFKDKGDKELASLSSLDGTKFQKAYIKAMIKGHTEALKKVDHFIKEAQNEDLKKYLINTKVTVEEHLAKAKKLK